MTHQGDDLYIILIYDKKAERMKQYYNKPEPRKVKHKKSKHQRIIDDIVNCLYKKGLKGTVYSNVEEYGVHELDIKITHDYWISVYEIKSNHTTKGYSKAHKQLQIRTRQLYEKYGINARGVYYAPQHGFERMYINGYIKS